MENDDITTKKYDNLGDPHEPTKFVPGTPEKMLLLRERCSLGIPLFNDLDIGNQPKTINTNTNQSDNIRGRGRRKHQERTQINKAPKKSKPWTKQPSQIKPNEPTTPTIKLFISNTLQKQDILGGTQKTCPETNKSFICGATTGQCWCMEIPIVERKSTDCTGPQALLNQAMTENKIRYSHCPECNTDMGPVNLPAGTKCPICQKIVQTPLNYENIKWINLVPLTKETLEIKTPS